MVVTEGNKGIHHLVRPFDGSDSELEEGKVVTAAIAAADADVAPPQVTTGGGSVGHGTLEKTAATATVEAGVGAASSGAHHHDAAAVSDLSDSDDDDDDDNNDNDNQYSGGGSSSSSNKEDDHKRSGAVGAVCTPLPRLRPIREHSAANVIMSRSSSSALMAADGNGSVGDADGDGNGDGDRHEKKEGRGNATMSYPPFPADAAAVASGERRDGMRKKRKKRRRKKKKKQKKRASDRGDDANRRVLRNSNRPDAHAHAYGTGDGRGGFAEHDGGNHHPRHHHIVNGGDGGGGFAHHLHNHFPPNLLQGVDWLRLRTRSHRQSSHSDAYAARSQELNAITAATSADDDDDVVAAAAAAAAASQTNEGFSGLIPGRVLLQCVEAGAEVGVEEQTAHAGDGHFREHEPGDRAQTQAQALHGRHYPSRPSPRTVQRDGWDDRHPGGEGTVDPAEYAMHGEYGIPELGIAEPPLSSAAAHLPLFRRGGANFAEHEEEEKEEEEEEEAKAEADKEAATSFSDSLRLVEEANPAVGKDGGAIHLHLRKTSPPSSSSNDKRGIAPRSLVPTPPPPIRSFQSASPGADYYSMSSVTNPDDITEHSDDFFSMNSSQQQQQQQQRHAFAYDSRHARPQQQHTSEGQFADQVNSTPSFPYGYIYRGHQHFAFSSLSPHASAVATTHGDGHYAVAHAHPAAAPAAAAAAAQGGRSQHLNYPYQGMMDPVQVDAAARGHHAHPTHHAYYHHHHHHHPCVVPAEQGMGTISTLATAYDLDPAGLGEVGLADDDGNAAAAAAALPTISSQDALEEEDEVNDDDEEENDDDDESSTYTEERTPPRSVMFDNTGDYGEALDDDEGTDDGVPHASGEPDYGEANVDSVPSASAAFGAMISGETSVSAGLHLASRDSKFETYACRVDNNQSDRSVEIALFSTARPHMRAFHFAWGGFFVAFFTWFAIAPLLSEIQRSLGLSKGQIWTSNICGVAGSALFRIMVGPICDKHGARWVMGLTLFISGLPCMATGLVNTATGLNMLRLVIGLSGSAFVTCQYWTSTMFTPEVAGTALALAAGWGNLGGGVAMLVMGSVLFPLFKLIYGETDGGDDGEEALSDRAWRTVCIIPGLFAMVFGYIVIKYSDDSPKGNYRKRNRMGLMPSVSGVASIKSASREVNTWLLFLQYACCFGVEITMTNAIALYFKEEFGQTTESAAAIASTFGWMNLFARGLGGFCSDISNANFGMKGRLTWQMISFVLEGVTVIIFGFARSLAGAIVALIVHSLFVQTSEGSTFAIVPYVKPQVTGSVTGLIGAGGNLGGVAFGFLFRQLSYRKAFVVMGVTAVASSFLTLFVHIRGYAGIISGSDSHDVEKRKKVRQVMQIGANPLTTSRKASSVMSVHDDASVNHMLEEIRDHRGEVTPPTIAETDTKTKPRGSLSPGDDCDSGLGSINSDGGDISAPRCWSNSLPRDHLDCTVPTSEES